MKARGWIVGCGVAVGLFMVPGAHAAPVGSLVAAIKAEVKIDNASPAFRAAQRITLSSPAEIRRAEKDLRTVHRLLETAANVVSDARATHGQRSAQRQWVHAARVEAQATNVLGQGLVRYLAGDSAAARQDIDQAHQLGLKARAQATRADKALGIPTENAQ